MINVPYAGHTNPTLPLARELVSHGHDVAYINAPEMRSAIEATGATFIPYLGFPKGLSAQQIKTRCFLAAYNTAMAVGKDYDLLVYEMFFYPGKTIADRLGIPCVRQFSQPAWNKPAFESMRKSSRLFLLSSKLIDIQVMNKENAKKMGMEGKRLAESVISEVSELNIVYLTSAFQPCRESFDDRFVFVGPSIPESPTSGTAFPYSQMQRPLIYISMGSIMSSKIFCRRCN